jgi:YD repeat-containing protein
MLRAGLGRLAVAVAVLGLAGQGAWAASGTRSSSFSYDTGSGLLTQEVVEPNTTAVRLQTDYTYDSFGHKVSVTVSGVDITTRSSTASYDTQGQFATGATNALSQSESWLYDARFGLPTSHTGPNGLTTIWSYDAFGRKTLEVRPDGTRTSVAYQYCSGTNGGTATCPTGAAYLVKMTPLASDGTTQNGPLAYVYMDKLDREVARDTQGFDGSTVRALKQYNGALQVSQTSRPYFLSSGTPQWTVFAYDALNRVTTTTAPDSSVTQIAYHGLVQVETNALSQMRTVTKNSQGQVVLVQDALSHTMSYAYDPFGNLTSTTDAAGNVVSATYDVRGRKITSSDPDMGAWSYSYNVLGELVSQTDAKSQTTTQSYDLLGRLVQRVEPDGTSTWTYDTATHGIGKLAASNITAGASAGYQRAVTYDTLSRPTQIATTINSTVYTMAGTYDGNGHLASVSYPSGYGVTYHYNSLGYAYQLTDSATSSVQWTLNTLDAEQHITQQTYGNGVVSNSSFSATTAG